MVCARRPIPYFSFTDKDGGESFIQEKQFCKIGGKYSYRGGAIASFVVVNATYEVVRGGKEEGNDP